MFSTIGHYYSGGHKKRSAPLCLTAEDCAEEKPNYVYTVPMTKGMP